VANNSLTMCWEMFTGETACDLIDTVKISYTDIKVKCMFSIG